MILSASYKQILERIKRETGLSDEEITQRVNSKLKQLSDLISKEGAVHIVANELGVKVFDEVGRVKIMDIIYGMRGLDIVLKVLAISEVRSFNRNGNKGKVVSFFTGDETGRIRVVLWDEKHIRKVEEGNINIGDIIEIKDAYVRENNGYKELHLGNRGELVINPEGEKIEEVADGEDMVVVKKIKELKENERNITLRGTIVQVFDPRFYEVCSECNSRLDLIEGVFRCREHVNVTVIYAAVTNCFFDDGSESIRVAAFRELAEKLLGIDKDKLEEIRNNPSSFSIIRDNALGKQLEIIGRVVKNEMFDRLEFVASGIKPLEAEKLIEEMSNDV